MKSIYIVLFFCLFAGCVTAPTVQERHDKLLMNKAVTQIKSYLADPDHADVAELLKRSGFPPPSEKTVRLANVATEEWILSLDLRFDLSKKLKSQMRQGKVARAAYGQHTCGHYLIELLILTETHEVLAIIASPGE